MARHDPDRDNPAATPKQSERKTALITGGGADIGRAAALALASEGYEVTVAGRTAATLEQSVKLVTHAGGSAKYVIADLVSENPTLHERLVGSHPARAHC